MPATPKEGKPMARSQSDGPDAPTVDEKQQAAGTVRLASNTFPVDSFDPGIEGVDPLTADGVDVPADKEDAVREAARAAGVSIKKVS